MQGISLRETWASPSCLARNAAEGVTKALTCNGGGSAPPAQSHGCNPHTGKHVRECRQVHHKPPGGSCQVQACHGGTSHPM
ncbi:hypothetical protein OIU74_025082 [Salix koriyanagi]|uniref:Uncharacterized protein n=1 Tax=Salix koriyanagi TaxID=2511006 RepID=A0A9Q1A562_9ROSI|nr:hypothetical protein OIU74_025082 [Salix koriyanagi]